MSKPRSLIAVVLGLIAAGGAFVAKRRKQGGAEISPNIYTPPLPKP
jgi:hypothetical protein